MLRLRQAGALTTLLLLAGNCLAQVPAPPPPDNYQTIIKYAIRAERQERVAQFREMLAYFESLGFKKEPGPENEPEDADLTLMRGTISAANARKLLLQRHVRAVLVAPAGFDLTAEGDKPVRVEVGLTGGLEPVRQAQILGQVQNFLVETGFRPALGFDNRGNTRIVGTLAADQAPALLNDLRWHATGWYLPAVPVDRLPSPVRYFWPVNWVEVTPLPAGTEVKETVPPTAVSNDLLKITPELRAVMEAGEAATRPTRMELFLSFNPESEQRNWRMSLIQAAPGLVIEGQLGQQLAIVARPDQVAALAALPFVSTLRLPRSGQPQMRPRAVSAAEASWRNPLHAYGLHGRGVRLAIIDGDFRGYREQLGKGLPAGTRYLDLTLERNGSLEPDPFPGDPGQIGHGTQAALVAARAAPEADLTLIRIDPAAPHQLVTLARFLAGQDVWTVGLAARAEQLANEAEELRQRRAASLEVRRSVLDFFGQDEKTVQRREQYFKNLAQLERDEAALLGRQERFLKLVRDLRELKGVHVVASTLVWNEGYVADGSNPISRQLADQPVSCRKWFQAAGNTHGQVWAGALLDLDKNGVAEFATNEVPLPPGRWSRELNFLGWDTYSGIPRPELPANARLRLSLQWREPHASEFLLAGEDLYRTPLAQVRLLVLRQLDPAGKQRPADDLELIAQSPPLPQRLEIQPSYGTYEQTVEFTAEQAGRYVVRLEVRVPEGIRPPGVPTLPALLTSWDLQLRLAVNVLDETSRALGRPVFLDFVTDTGSVGVPGDVIGVTVVGATNSLGRPQPFSARGGVFGAELLRKPDLWAVDESGTPAFKAPWAFGTSLTTPFVAGRRAAELTGSTGRR